MDNSEEQPMENWKQFHGTELGGLMSQLYGNQNKPKINYPKPKQRKDSQPTAVFLPGGGKVTAVDPRKATRRPVSIDVPKPTGGVKSKDYKPIDLVIRRRNSDMIGKELEEIRMKQTYYRPAHTRDISSDAEKERLSQMFTHKGK